MGLPLNLDKTFYNLEKNIRCKCSKYWGMKNHKKTCKRCKSEVIARGEKQ